MPLLFIVLSISKTWMPLSISHLTEESECGGSGDGGRGEEGAGGSEGCGGALSRSLTVWRAQLPGWSDTGFSGDVRPSGLNRRMCQPTQGQVGLPALDSGPCLVSSILWGNRHEEGVRICPSQGLPRLGLRVVPCTETWLARFPVRDLPTLWA